MGYSFLSGSSIDPFDSVVGPRLTSKSGQASGIIMAGGDNSRISTNKALLTLHGRPIIADTLDTLAPIFEEILIVTNRPQEYTFLNTEAVKDIIPRKGPLGGLYTGLTVSKNRYNFVVACDMPYLNPDLILYLLDRSEGFDVVVPQLEAGLEPLHAVYSKACLEPILTHLIEGDLKVQSFYGEVRTEYVQQREIERFDPELRAFFNINCREDLQKVKALAKGGRHIAMG
ncbi:MAG: molybdenum cofactor guanylyltransferase [bacterium]